MLGERMRLEREAAGWTQGHFGEMLGVSNVTINRYEQGVRRPDPATLEKIATIYGVTVDYLLGRSVDQHGTVTSNPHPALADLLRRTINLDDDDIQDVVETWELGYKMVQKKRESRKEKK